MDCLLNRNNYSVMKYSSQANLSFIRTVFGGLQFDFKYLTQRVIKNKHLNSFFIEKEANL